MRSEVSRGFFLLVGGLGCHTSCRAGEDLRSAFVLRPLSSPAWGLGTGVWGLGTGVWGLGTGKESRPGLSPLGKGFIPVQPSRS